jgi:hypothetical protein
MHDILAVLALEGGRSCVDDGTMSLSFFQSSLAWEKNPTCSGKYPEAHGSTVRFRVP